MTVSFWHLSSFSFLVWSWSISFLFSFWTWTCRHGACKYSTIYKNLQIHQTSCKVFELLSNNWCEETFSKCAVSIFSQNIVRLNLAWLKDNFCCWFQTKPAAAAGKAAPKSAPKKQQLKGKGLKKKKVALKFVIDCTHPVEDSILDVANFVSFYLILYFDAVPAPHNDFFSWMWRFTLLNYFG